MLDFLRKFVVMEEIIVISIGVIALIFLIIYLYRQAKSHNCADCQFTKEH